MTALPVGSSIGILGGGQLARMLSVAASRLGYACHVYDPDPNAPAGQTCARLVTAAYDDFDALKTFASNVNVITYEFENIPTSTLDFLEDLRPIHPGRQALATSQDRLVEKEFLSGLGLHVAPYFAVETQADCEAAMTKLGTAAILKTRRFGYDGKGQARLNSPADAAQAVADMNGAAAVLEGFVDFTSEVSVIAARSLDGQISCYDPGENVHKDGILHTTTIPATMAGKHRMDAILLAGRILNALDYVGVMGVELFVTATGLIVNEIAPRVHNSGHWTQNGCDICQFEQHIRAVAGLPLGDGSRHSDIQMENLIGDDMDRVPELIASGVAVHLYGKSETRKGRKMGHVNRRLIAS